MLIAGPATAHHIIQWLSHNDKLQVVRCPRYVRKGNAGRLLRRGCTTSPSDGEKDCEHVRWTSGPRTPLPSLHDGRPDLRFFAEYPPPAGGLDVDTGEADEVIDAIAKTFAELTSQQGELIRQQLIQQLMREIMNYDAEFRREDAAGVIGSHARH